MVRGIVRLDKHFPGVIQSPAQSYVVEEGDFSVRGHRCFSFVGCDLVYELKVVARATGKNLFVDPEVQSSSTGQAPTFNLLTVLLGRQFPFKVDGDTIVVTTPAISGRPPVPAKGVDLRGHRFRWTLSTPTFATC